MTEQENRAAFERADAIAKAETEKIMAVIAAFGERDPLVGSLMVAWILQGIVQTLYFMAEDKKAARSPEGIPGQVQAILDQAFKEWPARKEAAQKANSKLITLN